jgi:hypothetical protein
MILKIQLQKVETERITNCGYYQNTPNNLLPSPVAKVYVLMCRVLSPIISNELITGSVQSQ